MFWVEKVHKFISGRMAHKMKTISLKGLLRNGWFILFRIMGEEVKVFYKIGDEILRVRIAFRERFPGKVCTPMVGVIRKTG